MRKFALLVGVSVVALLSSFAHAQQFDLAVGAGELFSTRNRSASEAYLPPSEKGGIYPSVTIDRIFSNKFGYSAEISTLYKERLYNGFQEYRPFFYDLNAVYAPHVAKKTTALFGAGAGGTTVLFYNSYAGCGYPGGCVTKFNSNHFLLHLSAGVSYNVWRKFFVRPEANFYRVVNNNEFHSGNVLRLGASVGYTFHRD